MTLASVETSSKFWHSRNPNDWVPFEWAEPSQGPSAVGEIAIARAHGTAGQHIVGFWRTRAGAPGCGPDGACRTKYSAPLGDECMIVLDGEATVTVTRTGQTHTLTAGTIMIHPKNLEVTYDIAGPYFKKYVVIWDSPTPAPNPPQDLTFGNINDNPDQWDAYHWDEPEGPQVQGELYFITKQGSTGMLWAGIWRAGPNMPGCTPEGTATGGSGAPAGECPYTSIYGDETEYLLEGRVRIVDRDAGEEYHCQAGDVIGFAEGRRMMWSPKAPYMKKFWVITNPELPTEE